MSGEQEIYKVKHVIVELLAGALLATPPAVAAWVWLELQTVRTVFVGTSLVVANADAPMLIQGVASSAHVYWITTRNVAAIALVLLIPFFVWAGPVTAAVRRELRRPRRCTCGHKLGRGVGDACPECTRDLTTLSPHRWSWRRWVWIVALNTCSISFVVLSVGLAMSIRSGYVSIHLTDNRHEEVQLYELWVWKGQLGYFDFSTGSATSFGTAGLHPDMTIDDRLRGVTRRLVRLATEDSDIWKFAGVAAVIEPPHLSMIVVPVWMALTIVGVIPFVAIVRRIHSHFKSGNNEAGCRRCGYNLTANTSGVCPECGTAVTKKMEGGP